LSFDPLRRHPRVRRVAPWIAWAAVFVVVLWLVPGIGTFGAVAASAEVREASVVAPRTARVVKVYVQPGDAVQAGDALVDLDASAADLELAIARAELERLRVSVVARELDVRGTDLESAARLAQEAERAAVDLAALLSNEKRDRAELAQIDELIERQERLVEQKLASAAQRDELKLQRASLAQRVMEYGALLKAARDHEQAARDRLRTWRAAREKAGGGSVPLEERVAPERAEVAAQEERVRQLELMREGLKLTAPIAGLVSEVLVTDGDAARVDEPVLLLVDNRPQVVIAWVDERAAHSVQPGARAILTPSDGSGGRRVGTVEKLAPSISELPLRFRPIPTQPAFGRAVYIRLPPDEGSAVTPALPGQAFDVVFEGGP
jgi:HlyD family secretion protein